MAARLTHVVLWTSLGFGRSTKSLVTGGRSAATRRCVANAQYLKETFLDKGVMGLQTGQGYYSYPEPSYHQLGFSDVPDLSKVSELASKAKLI